MVAVIRVIRSGTSGNHIAFRWPQVVRSARLDAPEGRGEFIFFGGTLYLLRCVPSASGG